MDETYGAAYAAMYRGHWWFRARRRVLLEALGTPPRHAAHRRVLDVGCGDGLFFSDLAAFGRVEGIEVEEALLDPAGPHRSTIRITPLGQDPRDREPHDLVVALDVMEHVEDDAAFAAGLFAATAPGGRLLLTVPAFEQLWDRHDEVNHHFRRYTPASLRARLEGAGFKLDVCRCVFPSLYGPKRAVAAHNRRRRAGQRAEVDQLRMPPGWLNRLAESWLVAEDRLQRRLQLNVGSSVLAEARRAPSGTAE